jgi:hypothetical protein
MVDNSWVSKSGLIETDDPIREHHDVNAQAEAFDRMLAGETPNWYKWPQEYKQFVKESFAAERANSLDAVKGYKWEDQDELANKDSRRVNRMPTRLFLERLKKLGVKTVALDNGYQQGKSATVGLWCVPPSRTDKLRYVSYLDVPFMYEWSVLSLDGHGLPNGEETRGWRTVLVQLVQREILSEVQIHQEFGVPSPNARSKRYFRSLWETRNGKRYLDPSADEAVKL